MTTIMSLPSEVIDKILSYGDISFEDIINFRCVCKQFQWAAKTVDYCFQKKKFFQRWPSAKKYYNELHKEKKQKKSEKNEQKDKKCVSFIKTGIYCVRQLRNDVPHVMFLSNYERHKESIARVFEAVTKIKVFRQLHTINCKQILFFMDEIKHLFTQSLRTGCDLTERCCYIKLLDSLRAHWREFTLRRYIKKKSYHKELLEESATILAQQLQLGKDVSYSSVKASLNIITLDALNFFRKKHPKHSIFTTPDECFSHWENSNIDDNYWSEAEGTQIMDTLEEYMFDKLNFRSINSKELKYICIDYVLKYKCGQDLILFVIYHSVARRLGLRCDVVFFDHLQFLEDYIRLFWIPRYTFTADDTNYSSIIMDKEYKDTVRCFNISSDKFPDCINQMHLKWPLPSRNKFAEIEDYVPETRPKEVKFAVGMIVKHSTESTDCSTGVIIGWYQNYFDNERVTWPMHNISNYVMPLKCSNFNATKDQQTYYVILTESDKLCHVEEDAITLTKPNWIENKNIYRYFCKFEGTHYVPNEDLAIVYPHDAAVTARTLFKQ